MAVWAVQGHGGSGGRPRHPHSRGGWTRLENGQILCRHNTLKRANVPWNFELREIEKRRLAYYPAGVSGAVVRRAPRTTWRKARAAAPTLEVNDHA